MGNSIQVTFKKINAEQDLKHWLLKKRNRSCFIKDILQLVKDLEEMDLEAIAILKKAIREKQKEKSNT